MSDARIDLPADSQPVAPAAPAVTRLLSAWRAGDNAALQALTPLVYEELRQLAHRFMRRERNSHTLQATAVVHEAFVKMVGMEVPWQDRAHFYAVASTLMRRILVDHAKSKHRAKRGGGAHVRSLETIDMSLQDAGNAGSIDLVEIDEALQQLAKMDERMAQTVELHYFGGLTCTEVAQVLAISEATVHRDLRMAKAWILKQLQANERKEPDTDADMPSP